MEKKKHIVVLTGAGISAESGIKTFRDADGLWEGHDVMEVASPEGFRDNQDLVLDFYNQRRAQLHEVQPNPAHLALAALEKGAQVTVITQNVDDLHERAGSKDIIHLHGELRKVRSVKNPNHIIEWEGDLVTGDLCPQGGQLRPHIVWFGEAVPKIEEAAEVCRKADVLIIIGTSMQVYPAAGLAQVVPRGTKVYYIDPHPAAIHGISNLEVIAETASIAVPKLVEKLLK